MLCRTTLTSSAGSDGSGALVDISGFVKASRVPAKTLVSDKLATAISNWMDPVAFGVTGRDQRDSLKKVIEAARCPTDPATNKIVANIHAQLKDEAPPGELPLKVKAIKAGAVFEAMPTVPEGVDKAAGALKIINDLKGFFLCLMFGIVV